MGPDGGNPPVGRIIAGLPGGRAWPPGLADQAAPTRAADRATCVDDHASASRQRGPCTEARTTSNPSRAGGEISAAIPEGETMRLCGWCTRAMFDRDKITDEQDLAAAMGKRFEGTPRTQELATWRSSSGTKIVRRG